MAKDKRPGQRPPAQAKKLGGCGKCKRLRELMEAERKRHAEELKRLYSK